MIQRAADLTPAMQAIADYLEFSTRQRFETGKAPDGTSWKPSLRAIRDGGKTLVERGMLLASIDRAFGPDSATVGTNIVYARAQQLGATIRPRAGNGKKALNTPFGPRSSVKLPARPFIGFSTDDESEVFEILREHLSGEPSA